MAASAFTAGLKSQSAVRHGSLRMESGVALQAELTAFAPHQEHPVATAMRVVAGDAAFHFHSGMFIDERTPFFDVTIHTGFRARIIQAGKILRAVRVVAIRALHQAFRNTMMIRQREFGLHGLMACEAERWFRLLQQAVVQPARLVGDLRQLEEMRLRIAHIAPAVVFDLVDQMGGVALIAGNPVARMFRVCEELLLFAGDMAGQTARRVFIGCPTKREQGKIFQRFGGRCVVTVRSLYSVGVRFCGPMASLATLDVFLIRENQFRVSGLSVFGSNFFVAAFAAFRARKRGGGCVKFGRSAGDRGPVSGLRLFLCEDCGWQRCNRKRQNGKSQRRA